MYIHIGNGHLAAEEDLIGIFDLDNITASPAGEEFLRKNEKNGRLSSICGPFDLPKSVVVTARNNNTAVILSSITSQTITKRQNPLEEPSLFPDI